MEEKVMTESLFKGKKASYLESVKDMFGGIEEILTFPLVKYL
jgi:hypothetical protein